MAQLSGQTKGIMFAMSAACFYGCVPIFTKSAFSQGVPAIETVLMRTTFISIVLGVVALLRGEKLSFEKAAWPSFLLQALATFMVSTCYLVSVQFIPVGLAVIIFFAFPVIIIVAAPLIEGKKPNSAHIALAVLAFMGLATAIGFSLEKLDFRGVILAVLAALGCTVQFFSGRALGRFLKPAVTGALVHIAILPFVLALSLLMGVGHLQLASGTLEVTGYVLVAGVCVVYVGGYFFHMTSLKAAPASVVAPYFNLEPIVTTIISVLYLQESLSFQQYGGGALVLAALLLAGFVGKRNDTA